MPHLVAVGGSEDGRRISLRGAECVVGRRLDCDVAIQDPRISRRHARFFHGPDGIVVEDLGSVNGTFVNGRRLKGPSALAHGDEVAVGGVHFRVELTESTGSTTSEHRVSIVDGGIHAPPVIEVAALSHRDPMPLSARRTDPMREVARLEGKLKTLYRLGEAVASSLEPRALLEHVVGLLLEVFAQARAATALSLEVRGAVPHLVVHRAREGTQSYSETVIPAGVLDRVVREGRSVLLRSAMGTPAEGNAAPNAPTAERFTRVPAAPAGEATGYRMGAPLQVRGEVLGVLHVEADPELGAFTQGDLDLLGGIAAQAGVALHVASLHRQERNRERLAQDLVIARQIQRNLLPREAPALPGLKFAVHYEPAFEVGGDFYAFLPLGTGSRLAVTVGDVSGKAISAALYMARVATELRAAAPLVAEPDALLERVNAAMSDAGDDGMFCTALVVAIDPAKRTARLCNAGHTVALLRRRDEVTSLEFPAARTPPLGLDRTLDARSVEVSFEPGDLLLLYTDGLIEARSPDGAFYGEARVAEAFRRAPHGARAVVDALLHDLDEFVRDARQADDQTIVCVELDVA